MEPPQGRAEIEKLFGNPSMINGKLNEEWARANIMLVPTPNNWQLYYQNSGKLTKIPGIRMHKLLKDLFLKSLNEIWNYAKQEIGDSPSDDTIRNWLHNLRVDQTNGGFEFRAITGGTQLSLHSYGIAIDWDADHNPRKKPLSKTLPDWWYNIWSTNGWSNGCHFPTPDPMHIQYATNAFMFDEYEAIFNKKIWQLLIINMFHYHGKKITLKEWYGVSLF